MSADEYDIVGTYCAGVPESNAEFAKAFSKYFQTIKLFDGTDYVFNKLGYKKPIEQSGDGHFNFNVDGYNNGAFITKNGMIIAPSGCWWTGKTGVDFIVDTNGNKGPNKFGYDVFYFQINGSDRLVPANLDEHFFNIVSEQSVCCDMEVKSSTCSGNNGTACSHFALKNEYPNDTTKPYWESLR